MKLSNYKSKKLLLFFAEDITDERMKKLIRWREERNRKKKLEAAMQKPAFKVGVVHHSLCSPIKRDVSIATAKTPKKTEHSNYIQKRITRATEKRLLAKAAAAKQVNLPFMSLKHASVSIQTPISNTKKQKSFAPVDYCFKPPSGLQKIPLFGLVPIKQTPQEKCTSPQKSAQTSDSTTKNIKTSTNSKLSSNKQNSSQKLNETFSRDSELDTKTKELETKTIRSSLKKAKNQIDIQDSKQEENSLSNNTDTKTPSKISPISFEKENYVMEDLIIFSPYLTRSRGKRNSRKEGQQRLGLGRSSDEIPTKDTVMKNLNICVEEEERTAQYFKFLVNKETDRLKELCKKWLDIGIENEVPEDATYEIQQAVGQTNLLINKKFERFRGLVQDCETGKGEMLVTCRDLQGFWDMTYMEVKDCDMRFEKLEQRRNRGWQEEEYIVAKPAIKKRRPIKKQIVSSKPSSLRSLILAARKNKMEPGTLSTEVFSPQIINEKPSNRKSFVELEENTNTRHSTKRSKIHDLNESKSTPARHESSRPSLIQKVQFSDKSKRMKSPFAAMKISQMCKTPEVQLDDTVSYVNSDQTPGKGILKKSEELENKEARIKSSHKVNFDDQVALTEVSLDEEEQARLNLAAALNRIDNLDLDKINPLTSPSINVEKRLDFEDSDSNDDLNELELEIKTLEKGDKSKSSIENTLDIVHPFNDVTSSVSIKELSPNDEEIILPRKNLRNRVQKRKDASNRKSLDILFSPSIQANRDDEIGIMDEIISKDMEDLDLGMKVLRNRIVPASNTPKSSRISKMVSYDVNVF